MKNRVDTVYLILFLIFFIVSFLTFGMNVYSPYSDIGRELYIPQQILNGEVLYKDIFNVYPPLSYLLNAFFIMLLGDNFLVFSLVGFFTSFLTLIPLYLIAKKYTDNHIAFFVIIFLSVSCIFYPSISNWILPYSYGIVYALCSILWAFYFVCEYIDSGQSKYFYISTILCGLSICFKYEYFAFVLVLILSLYYKKDFLKLGIKSLLFFFIFPVFCLFILLFQGCSFLDLFNALAYMFSLSKSESVNYFYSYSGISISKESFNIFKELLFNQSLKYLFYISPFVCFLLMLFSSIKKDFNLFILLFTSILLSLKSLGGISFEIYGTYFFPLLFISIIGFLYKFQLKYKTIILCILCLCFFSIYQVNNFSQIKGLVPLKTEKGSVYIPFIFLNSTNELLNYIDKNIDSNEKILILPEGVFINYLLDKKSDNYLYYLIPPNNDIFDKSLIISKLKSKDVKYIILTNISYPWYNQKSFMNGWGSEYFKLIKQNYKLNDILGNNLKFYVYERDII